MQDLQAEQINSGTPIPGETMPPSEQIERTDAPAREPSDTEARARAMGWVPKEEFRGPADNWRDADEFVRRGEEELPVARERLKETTRKVADLERKLRETAETHQRSIAQLERMSTRALDIQRQQIHASYEAAKRDAVSMADTDRYAQLVRDQQQALQQHDEQTHQAVVQPQRQPNPNGPPPLSPTDEATVNGWIEKNRWFQADEEMNLVAQRYHVKLGRERPGLSLEENLRETESYIRQRYPDKFGSTQRTTTAAAVEGGTRLATPTSRAKGANELPADARRQGEKFVKEGLFKDINEYAKDYWSQD